MKSPGLMGVIVAAAALVVAASAPPQLRIVEPTHGAYLSGPVELRAVVDPPEVASRVKSLVFFVDGREACTLEQAPFLCEWEAGRDVTPHVIRAVATLDDGTRLSTRVRTEGLGYADRVDVDAVQISVVVTDAEGRFVEGLPRSAFRLFEDGKPQVITSFAAEDVPLTLAAAVDMSESMTEAMPEVKRAAQTFLGALGPQPEVTLLAFNDNVVTLARRATSPDARNRAVARLTPWGGTALYDAIIRGMDQLSRRSGRRALVVFSDGDDTASRATPEAAIERVEASDATVYTVGFGQATTVKRLRDLLSRIATLSGGQGLLAAGIGELERVFADIIDDLSHQYLLGYQPRDQRHDGRWRTLEVEVEGAGYRVRHRQGYRLVPQ